jgi:hypothetical protein
VVGYSDNAVLSIGAISPPVGNPINPGAPTGTTTGGTGTTPAPAPAPTPKGPLHPKKGHVVLHPKKPAKHVVVVKHVAKPKHEAPKHVAPKHVAPKHKAVEPKKSKKA